MMKSKFYLLRTLCVGTLLAGCCGPLQAQHVALDWAKQVSGAGIGAGNNNGNAIATDAAGNIYTCGRFSGTADFDPGPAVYPLTANSAADIFVMKQDAAGQLLWARHMGGASPSADVNQAVSIAVDVTGNVYTTGIYAGTADFDPGPGVANLTYGGGWSDAFISKLDASGNYVWAKSYSGPGDESGSEIVLDESGNIYTYGTFTGTVDFDPGPNAFPMTATGVAGYVSKLDASGNFVWAKKLAGTGNFLSGSMAVSATGNLYLMGNISDGPVDVDPGSATVNIQPQGILDACVIKLDNNGNFGWVRQIGGMFSFAAGIKITVDKLEHISVAGLYLAGIDFSTAPAMSLSSIADEEIFLAKLDASGTFLWTKSTTGNAGASAELYGLKADPYNNLLLSGFFKGTVDFDPGAGTASMSTTSSAVANGFFVKLDNGGNFKWAKQVAAHGFSSCRAITGDVSGNVYTTGHFKDTADFDPGTGVTNLYTTGSKENIFVARYACTDTTSSLIVEAGIPCTGYSFRGITYNHSGIYTVTLPNAAGCDSTITLDLTITPFQVAITANQYTLQAAAAYTTYQWLKNGSAVAGATASSYQVTANGAYALVATNAEGCTDTSDVYTVSGYTGIDDINVIAAAIEVYPNPASDAVFINAPLPVNLTLTDITGKVLLQASQAKRISVAQLAAGVYLLRITDREGRILKTEKIARSR